VGAVRNRWIVVVACVLVGGILGLILTTLQSPSYESSAVIYQTPHVTDSDSVSRQRTEAYTELLTSDRLIETALKASGLQMSVSEARDATTAGANAGSAILTVTVRTDNADESARLANALAEALPETVASLDGSATGSNQSDSDDVSPVRLSLITPATPDDNGTGRNWGRNIALGVVAGLLVGLLYAYLRTQLSRRVQDGGSLSRFLSGPVLTNIPSDKALASGVVDFQRGSAAAEAFRRLRTAITGPDPRRGDCRTIVVSSSTDGDGKTTTAINLAVALAESGCDVVLVDASVALGDTARSGPRDDGHGDGRSPAGLADYLQSNNDIGEYVSASGESRLGIIAAGRAVSGPSELLTSSRMREGLADLAARANYVIIDTAALSSRSDAIVLGRWADAVLMVARSNHTRYADLGAGIERLALSDVPVLGVVLNDYPRPAMSTGRAGGSGPSIGRLAAGESSYR
jgi:capsular exopolysaccharide synthesis family protein